MMRLVPGWAENYEEFWVAIKRRNLLFIKLRYAAIAMLIAFSLIPQLFNNIKFSDLQYFVILVITSSIFFYNIAMQIIRPKLPNTAGIFNPMHLSLLQIILDLSALTLMIYFFGGIELPLYMFYIFHMIIGSLILPGYIIYAVAALAVFVVISIFGLEYLGIIPHHHIEGFLHTELYNDGYFLVSISAVFTMMMFTSVFIANRIAHQLYKREQQLVQILEKLNLAELRKQKYIMGVVHEIKTPIAAVQSLLDLVLAGFLGIVPEQIKEKLTRAKIRTQDSLELINSILRITRIRSLNESTSDIINIGNIFDDILIKVNDLIVSKGINIEVSGREFADKEMEGDKVLIELVFSNIIGNAIKYNRKYGDVKIYIEDKLNHIDIEICDNGIGIPAKEMKKIFEKNYRASNIKGKSLEGSGLGLSLVKEIVEQHRGVIKVQSPSKIGNKKFPGTCFTIKLPYIPSDSIFEKPSRATIPGGV